MRQGKYLGETARLSSNLSPGVAQLYALFAVSRMERECVGAASCENRRSLNMRYHRGAPARPAKHVVHAEIVGAEGKAFPY